MEKQTESRAPTPACSAAQVVDVADGLGVSKSI